jgi:hypothetical protein
MSSAECPDDHNRLLAMEERITFLQRSLDELNGGTRNRRIIRPFSRDIRSSVDPPTPAPRQAQSW